MNQLKADLKEAMIPEICVIREELTDEQLAEYQRTHPAKQYVRVNRVDAAPSPALEEKP